MTGLGRIMMQGAAGLLIAPAATLASSAAAEDATDERPYCAARPGMGTTPCTIAPHRLSLEVAVADWERDAHPGMHADTMLLGGIAARIGLGENSELSIEWTPFGETWVAGSGLPTTRGLGTGDLTVSTKVNLRNPDGGGFSIAVQPFLGLPIGGTALGSGQWATGIAVPTSYALGGPFSLQATPQVTLESSQRDERSQVSARVIGGLGVALSDSISLTPELSIGRQRDDGRTIVQSFAAMSVAYTTRNNFQFDVGAVLGLNDHSPDARLYAGVSHQF
jgi:hypothetical protein